MVSTQQPFYNAVTINQQITGHNIIKEPAGEKIEQAIEF